MNDPSKTREEEGNKAIAQDLALTTYVNLQKLMESEHRVIGLAWYAVVDELAPDNQLVANQQYGGCLNLPQIAAHYMDQTGRQHAQMYDTLQRRINVLENFAFAQSSGTIAPIELNEPTDPGTIVAAKTTPPRVWDRPLTDEEIKRLAEDPNAEIPGEVTP